MKRFALCRGIFLVACLVFTCVQARAESVPQLINYQGMLTDKDGNPVKTGEYKLSFNIYNTSAKGGKGDKLLWGPQTFSQVPVVRGNFNVLLGPVDDKDKKSISEAFKVKDTFLEISIDGQIIAPRQQILSAPYAIESQQAENATYATYATKMNDGRDILDVPIGSIIAWHKNIKKDKPLTLPSGWIECNGAVITDSLSPLYGERTPNLNRNQDFLTGYLRGLFLRGGTNSGDYQNDMFQEHQHLYNVYYRSWTTSPLQSSSYSSVTADKFGEETEDTTHGIVSRQGVNVRYGFETRPVNMSVVWIMRIK